MPDQVGTGREGEHERIVTLEAVVKVQKKIIDAQDKLLRAYRTGDQRMGGAAVDALIAARRELADA